MVAPALCRFLSVALFAPALLLLPARSSVAGESPPFKRLNQVSSEELERQLDAVPVIGLGNTAPVVLRAYAVRLQQDLNQVHAPVGVLDATPLLEVRPDLRTLPLRRGDASQLTARHAADLETLSRKLRVYLDRVAPINKKGQRPELPQLRAVLQSELRGKKPEWLRPEAIPTLQQMLMHEEKPVRMMLVEMLAAIPGKVSTTALARRAAFDLDPEVRQSAVNALRDRPVADGRQVLVSLLRYPWSPVADHAAEALANLHDRGAVGQLIAELDAPDPGAPQPNGEGGFFVRELVRVHHLTNCLVCHPAASTGLEPVLGADPVLPLSVATPGLTRAGRILQATPGSHSYGDSAPVPALLRGDITYLHQDFSVRQKLPSDMAAIKTASGPLSDPAQRFDFVVRRRPVSNARANQLKTAPGDRPDSPRRATLLFALRQITGKDAGDTSAAWLKVFPDAKVEAEAARRMSALAVARGERREQLLSRYRDEKGDENTLALSGAIPSLQGQFQEKTRDALAARLGRMSAANLRDKTRDDDAEVRRAAAVACGRKGDTGLVPDLIGLLDDKESAVSAAAASGLHALTGQSFPTAKEWQSWWGQRKAGDRVK
jgi:HEAT repeat protein